MQGKTRVGDTVRNITEEAEAEILRAIAYINDKVVPEVRRSSSAGLRLAAEQLQRMAEQLERAPYRERGAYGSPAQSSESADR